MRFLEIEVIAEIIIILLFIASLVGILVRRLRVPYTVTLVVVGLGSAVFLRGLAPEFIDPEVLRGLLVPQVILALLVPPLIFEAATHIKLQDLFRNLPAILTYAIPGLILTMFVVGSIVFKSTPLSWEMALVFGALIAATDPVAVVALFRSLGVPKKLTLLLEGESLFNDGTAIVIYHLMLTIIVGAAELSASSVVLEFFKVAGGGLIIGILVSVVISRIINQINEHLIEITLTTVAAYGSYLIAESFHVSGVLAVVAAGLILGNIGPRGMSPTTRIAMSNFWEYAAFLANSLVFLTIGLVIDLEVVFANLPIILLAIVVVLGARAISIYLFSYLYRDISLRLQHVLWWGGLRGAISLALALGLPSALNEELLHLGLQDTPLAASLGEMAVLVQAMAYGVVLFTLLVQGTTMQTLVKRLQLSQRTPAEEAYQQTQARAVASQAAYKRLKSMNEEGLISEHAWEMMEAPMRRLIKARTQAVREIMHTDRSLEIAELSSAYDEALRAQRSAYNNLLTSGAISEEIFAQLVSEVDSALISHDINYSDLLIARSPDRPPITHMICAVVHEEELTDVITMLNILAIPNTRLASHVSTDNQPRVTLLLGVEQKQIEEVVSAIIGCCSGQPEFVSPFARMIPAASGQNIEVQGMTVYVIEIDHYKEF